MPLHWVVLALALQAPAETAGSIDAGLNLYHRRQFTRAAAEFQKAADADPQSAAAAWYLAYTWYKIAEPKRPFHPDKQKAADMFAKAFQLDPTFKPTWGRK